MLTAPCVVPPKRADAPLVRSQSGRHARGVAQDLVRPDVLGADPRRGEPRVLRVAERESVEGWILADELRGALRHIFIAGRVYFCEDERAQVRGVTDGLGELRLVEKLSCGRDRICETDAYHIKCGLCEAEEVQVHEPPTGCD
jgi:hypothetical protein